MNKPETTDFPRKTLRVNGVALNVIDVGEGEPALLVHGFPDTHAVWRKQIPALVAAGYRYVALSVGHPSAYGSGGLAQKLKGWYILLFQLRGFAERALKARDWAL